ncbi:hypothetical protein HPB47_004029 [Ixodes persulcatus]|uniref:Uncharacterized protein n=1 Tax=Ixodes persulcatus TaxID=34615 RepID=A0AC60PGY3_IXOPE|nr:hypothetical protein HPB47_004029 [Ixodes persulcatus]
MSAGKRKVPLPRVKRAIVDEIRQNIEKADVVRKYEVARPTLSAIIMKESEIDVVLDNDVGDDNGQRIRKATYSDVEAALYTSFVDDRAKRDIVLGGDIVLGKARDLGFALGHKDFGPGKGQLWHFKGRHNIPRKSILGEAASVDDQALRRRMDRNLNHIFEYTRTGTPTMPTRLDCFLNIRQQRLTWPGPTSAWEGRTARTGLPCRSIPTRMA